MSQGPTLVRDRETGQVVEERVFGGNSLHFLYGTRRGRLLTEWVLSRRWFNEVYGWLQRTGGSRRRIPDFVDSLGINADEAEFPPSSYASLDAFFTRRLKAGARPIDRDPNHFVSPCDGRVVVFPSLQGRRLSIKGCSVSVDDLLGDPTLAEAYRGGGALVVRLAPADYHWFHFPADGTAGPSRKLAGRLHSVHAIALAAGAPSFVNQRSVSVLNTDRFGRLVLVEVGAMLVGTIVQRYHPGPVLRGDAKGLFRFGGSTVVVLAEAGRLVFDADLLADTGAGLETLVRMGTRLATAE